jgi:hypothetical protein
MPGAENDLKLSDKYSSDKGKSVQLAGSVLGDRSHVCAFFNDREDEYRLLLPFVRDGLERGEKIVYTIDPERRAEQMERLAAGGIDAATLLRNGRLEYAPGPTHICWTVTLINTELSNCSKE